MKFLVWNLFFLIFFKFLGFRKFPLATKCIYAHTAHSNNAYAQWITLFSNAHTWNFWKRLGFSYINITLLFLWFLRLDYSLIIPLSKLSGCLNYLFKKLLTWFPWPFVRGLYEFLNIICCKIVWISFLPLYKYSSK